MRRRQQRRRACRLPARRVECAPCPPRRPPIQRGVAASPTSFLKTSTSALSNDCLRPRSSTRSCGRRGPATLGCTVERSSSSVSLEYRMNRLSAPKPLFLAIPLDQIHLMRRARAQPHIRQRLLIHREESDRRAVFRAMLAIVARSATVIVSNPSPKNSTNFPPRHDCEESA